MSAWMLLAWVGAVCGAVLLVSITVLLVVSMVREIRKPKKDKHTIIGGDH
jgi:hypothetical protein